MIVRAVDIDDPDIVFTAEELCQLTHLEMDYIQELITCGIIQPRSVENSRHLNLKESQKRFTQMALVSIHKARRLQRDLGINLEGVALAIELMEQNRRLKVRTEFLENIVDRLYQ